MDTFSFREWVRIKNLCNERLIKGRITKDIPADDGTIHTYEVAIEDSKNFLKNGLHIHHSKSADSVYSSEN